MDSDLLRTGTQWLQQMRTAHCSTTVVYRRDLVPPGVTVQATYGKTSYEIGDGVTLTVHAQVWDFLISAADLTVEPEPGDVIVADGRKYEVTNLAGEGCWRWSDRVRLTYRIHTQDIGADT